MNTIDSLDKTTILHTLLSVGPMLPLTTTDAYLVARLPGDPDPELEGPLEFRYSMHPEVGAISVTFASPAFKATFVFDIWVDSTFDLFCGVVKRDCCEVVLRGPTGVCGVKCTDCRAEWTDALLHLAAMRASLKPREPSKFLDDALTLELCADFAVHPNDAKRMAASPAPLSATHFVLSSEHTDGWEQPRH